MLTLTICFVIHVFRQKFFDLKKVDVKYFWRQECFDVQKSWRQIFWRQTLFDLQQVLTSRKVWRQNFFWGYKHSRARLEGGLSITRPYQCWLNRWRGLCSLVKSNVYLQQNKLSWTSMDSYWVAKHVFWVVQTPRAASDRGHTHSSPALPNSSEEALRLEGNGGGFPPTVRTEFAWIRANSRGLDGVVGNSDQSGHDWMRLE